MIWGCFVFCHPLVGSFLKISDTLASLRSAEIPTISLLALRSIPLYELIGADGFVEGTLSGIRCLSLCLLVMGGVKDLSAGERVKVMIIGSLSD